uniref:Uncharacterized protein n=1 Tax=Arion vulgaris TaxID=1028688 RepID=A0A0B7ADM6_9EUPU
MATKNIVTTNKLITILSNKQVTNSCSQTNVTETSVFFDRTFFLQICHLQCVQDKSSPVKRFNLAYVYENEKV